MRTGIVRRRSSLAGMVTRRGVAILTACTRPPAIMAADPIAYCLTRDHELATAVDQRLSRGIAFFYNDAGRLHQAVTLRAPSVVLVDTGAVRPEYGDAGLGPVFDFLRHRIPDARLLVRPTAGAEHLVVAEAGPGVALVPDGLDGCVDALVAACVPA